MKACLVHYRSRMQRRSVDDSVQLSLHRVFSWAGARVVKLRYICSLGCRGAENQVAATKQNLERATSANLCTMLSVAAMSVKDVL